MEQVKEEKALGIGVTPYMVGLEKPKVFYKGEVGFFTAISLPLVRSMNEYFNGKLSQAEENTRKNITIFQKLYDEATE